MSKQRQERQQIKTRSQSKKQKRDQILDGLNLSRNGEYVKLDDNLLKRLKSQQQEEEIERPNPFENNPEFLETIKNGTPVTMEFLQECSRIIKEDPDAVKMADMIGNFPVDWLA